MSIEPKDFSALTLREVEIIRNALTAYYGQPIKGVQTCFPNERIEVKKLMLEVTVEYGRRYFLSKQNDTNE